METVNTNRYTTLRFLQLEPTTRCNLHCITCLKGQKNVTWHEQDFPISLAEKIFSENHQLQTVHLQGWGEPLLCPNIVELIRYCKQQDLQVSFTTNGTVMDENLAAELITSGLDAITFSMAGGTEQTQDYLRGEGSFRALLRSITTFNRVCSQLQARLPVAISYLLTPESVKELSLVLQWAKKNGIRKIATVHLTQSISSSQFMNRYFPVEKHLPEKLRRMRLNISALYKGIEFSLRQVQPRLTAVCDKLPGHSIFISASGAVSPCVFLHPPIEEEAIPWYDGQSYYPEKKTILGSLHNQTLESITNAKPFNDFMEPFDKRRHFHDRALSPVSYSMEGAAQLEKATLNIREEFSKVLPPSPCRHCCKMEGF